MKQLICILIVFFLNHLEASVPIVFVHIGPKIPEYAHDAIDQAALFNPESTIYMLGHSQALNEFGNSRATLIPLESLKQSNNHMIFNRDYRFPKTLFHYAIERFYFLSEFVEQYDLKDVFHLEYDNMLYVDVETFLPIFHEHYPTIAATFDNDNRCIPGFVYISDSKSLTNLIVFMTKHARRGTFDMQLIALYKIRSKSKGVRPLPVIPREYTEDHPLVTKTGSRAKKPDDYTQHVDEFQSLFDAAALGQYLGGTDPAYSSYLPGFVNESSVYNPEKFTFVWEEDSLGRLVPYAVYRDKKFRLNNLHIHCKNLKKFAS